MVVLLTGITYLRLTVAIVFLVSFTLYGIEGIAEEIGPALPTLKTNSRRSIR